MFCRRLSAVGFVFFVCAFATSRAQLDSDKCSEKEMLERSQDLDICVRQFDIELAENINANLEDNHKLICRNIRQKTACFRTLADACFNPDKAGNIIRNYLSEQTQVATNHSDTLGRDFVDNCPILREFQVDFMIYYTGSTKCSFFDYITEYIPRQKACNAKVDTEFENSLAISNFLKGETRRQFILNQVCDLYHKITQVCRKALTDACFSEEASAKLAKRDNENNFDQLRDLVRRTVDPSFTYAGSCDGQNLSDENEDTEIIFDLSRKRKRRSPALFNSDPNHPIY